MEMGESFLKHIGNDRTPKNADPAKIRELERMTEYVVPADSISAKELAEAWRNSPPGKVIHLKPPKPYRDYYGYWAMLILGIMIGVCSTLLAVGR